MDTEHLNEDNPCGSVTYSVSFCDTLNEREFLLPRNDDIDSENIGEIYVPRSSAIDIDFGSKLSLNSSHCPCCPMSLPADYSQLRYGIPSGEVGYGSLPNNMSGNSTAKKIIYCVHGKPGGCCATVVSGGKPPAIPITIVDEHCHQDRGDLVDRKARRKLIVASILCLLFMVGEIVGGYLSGSLAIATDAAHLLTDFASFMISLFALWMAQRKPSRLMPFGWHRAEVIGALTSVLAIWLVTGILVYMAVERVIHEAFEIDAMVMLITSGLGVLVNLIMGLTLHQHGHGSHSHDENTGAKNINVRAAFIHVVGDLLQSIGVLVAAIVIYYKPEWKIVDPICTFLFSILVLFTTVSIMKDTLIVLMEGIPKDVDFQEVLNTFLSIDGVVKVHNLRIWALSLDKTALSAHLAIDRNISSSDILKTASRKIHSKYNFFEMTLQIENFQQNMENCAQCQVPS